MDIEIIIKGGEELSEFYPKNYKAFEKKISEMILEMFPGVGGWWISPELTDKHQTEENKRQQIRQQKYKETLLKVLREPGVRDLIHSKVAVPVGAQTS